MNTGDIATLTWPENLADPRGDGYSDEENSSLNSSSDKSQPGVISYRFGDPVDMGILRP